MKRAFPCLKVFWLLSLLCCPVVLRAEYNEIVRPSSEFQVATDSIVLSAGGQSAVLASGDFREIAGDSNSASDIFLFQSGSGLSRISNNPGGTAANGASISPAISQDGQIAAFVSSASDLVSNDSNNSSDIFVYDIGSGAITRVSQRSDGTQANGPSHSPALSADGRFVAFVSTATNLDSLRSDTNSLPDIFVHDRNAGTTARVNLAPGSSQANGASSSPVVYGHGSDDFYVVFSSAADNLVSNDENQAADIFFYDSAGAGIELLSIRANGTQGDGASTAPHMSSDGRYVVFQSTATNLVTNDSNNASDIFWLDRNTPGSLERVSLSTAGTDSNGSSGSPKVSNDGSYILFVSDATNLINNDVNAVADIFMYDRGASGLKTSQINISAYGNKPSAASSAPFMQGTGKYVAFLSEDADLVSGDSNSVRDGFIMNTECIVDFGSYSTDTDGDSTLNCDETCGADPLKTLPGACGCGIPDSDTDSDGTEDCNEICDSDPLKLNPGDCGCGIADTDTNGNGKGDCVDPASSTIPDSSGLFLRPLRNGQLRSLEVNFPGEFTGVKYTYTLYLNGLKLFTRSTRRTSFTLKNVARGRYSLRYRVSLGGITSKWSKKVSKRVK